MTDKLYHYECPQYRVEEQPGLHDLGDGGDYRTLYKVTVLVQPTDFYLNHEHHEYVAVDETFWTYDYPDVQVYAS